MACMHERVSGTELVTCMHECASGAIVCLGVGMALCECTVRVYRGSMVLCECTVVAYCASVRCECTVRVYCASVLWQLLGRWSLALCECTVAALGAMEPGAHSKNPGSHKIHLGLRGKVKPSRTRAMRNWRSSGSER